MTNVDHSCWGLPDGVTQRTHAVTLAGAGEKAAGGDVPGLGFRQSPLWAPGSSSGCAVGLAAASTACIRWYAASCVSAALSTGVSTGLSAGVESPPATASLLLVLPSLLCASVPRRLLVAEAAPNADSATTNSAAGDARPSGAAAASWLLVLADVLMTASATGSSDSASCSRSTKHQRQQKRALHPDTAVSCKWLLVVQQHLNIRWPLARVPGFGNILHIDLLQL